MALSQKMAGLDIKGTQPTAQWSYGSFLSKSINGLFLNELMV